MYTSKQIALLTKTDPTPKDLAKLRVLAAAAVRYRQILDHQSRGTLFDGMTPEEHHQRFIDTVDGIVG